MFPFFNNYPGTDLHEIDLAYILKLCAELRASNTTLTAWKAQHEAEYADLANKVEGLINNLVDVIVPWDSSIAYHVFSIVEYQGTNYIAVQDVPVGAMITNTDYWQPANTVVEQINAIGVIVSELQKGLDYVTPEMYGAAGDGVTDDTAAITEAFNSGLPIMANGIYKLDSVVGSTESTNHVDITGGEIRGTFYCGSLNACDTKFVHDNTTDSYLTVRINGPEPSCIHHCVFDAENSATASLLSIKGDGSIVTGCVLQNNTGRDGISIRESSNVIISDNILINIRCAGIQIYEVCNNVKICNNVLIDCNNNSEYADGCISTYGDTTGTGTTSSENLTISGNTIILTADSASSMGNGIRINGVKGCKVEGNYISTRNLTAFYIVKRTHDTYIVENSDIEIKNNYVRSAQMLIRLIDAKNIDICGNEFIHDSGTVASGTGIQLGQSSNEHTTGILNFINNTFKENGTGAYQMDLTGTSNYDITLSGNVIDGSRCGAIQAHTLRAYANTFHAKAAVYCFTVSGTTSGFIFNNVYGYKGHSNGVISNQSSGSMTVENNYNDGSMYTA